MSIPLQPAPDSIEADCARHWLALSLGVLVLAGLFALVVVVGRMPPFDRLVTDPLFFKRGLVAHVNLALVAWFYSFVSALLFLVPGRRAPSRLARHSADLGALGVLMMLVAAGLPDARPVLANYVPSIDHWLFTSGQITFGIAVVSSFWGRRLLPSRFSRSAFLEIPPAARTGLRAAALALLLAALTFAVSWIQLPRGAAVEVRYELLAWGGGHVLQLVCTIAMVSVWLMLLGAALGRSPVSAPAAVGLFAALLGPWLIAPLLPLLGTWTASYRVGFTQLMQWSIFPVVSIFLVLCFAALVRARRDPHTEGPSASDPRIAGFLISAALTVLGFALGAAIRGSSTMIPAHYHAAIGGVTAAFMAASYPLLGALGFTAASPRLRRASTWQPVVYGAGQMVFAAGFGLAGAYGMARKSYGAEQAARGAMETLGLAVMGVGGLIAIAGGLLFLGIVAVIWRRGTTAGQLFGRSTPRSYGGIDGIQRSG